MQNKIFDVLSLFWNRTTLYTQTAKVLQLNCRFHLWFLSVKITNKHNVGLEFFGILVL